MKILSNMSLFFAVNCLSGLVVFATRNLFLLIRDLKKPTSEVETSEYARSRELNHLRNLSWPIDDYLSAGLRAHLQQQTSCHLNKKVSNPEGLKPYKFRKDDQIAKYGGSSEMQARKPKKRTRRGKRGGKRVQRKANALRSLSIDQFFGRQIGSGMYLDSEEENLDSQYQVINDDDEFGDYS